MQENILQNQIQKLPEDLINQIKAGEVVERPASVVKELVENSIDAQASQVYVELLDGGKQLIRITDNGIGIASKDLSLALERHATSKIKAFTDLEKIASFGFRGEALPSIASVSEFTIKSTTKEQNIGREVMVSKGKITSEKDIIINQGTVIQAKDLFCNVPARLKFLKSTSTEYTHIHDFLLSISFYYHHISFRLNHNGREVFHYKQKDSSLKRFEEILGADAHHYAPVNFKRGSFKVTGFSLLPEKASSLPQYFVTFVNGRLVKDKIIRAGVLQAYQGLLLKGLLPSSVIFINVDPAWIDVNVHPAKTEVRFSDPLAVQELIAMGIQNSIKEKINQNYGKTSFPTATDFSMSPSAVPTGAAAGSRHTPQNKEPQLYRSETQSYQHEPQSYRRTPVSIPTSQPEPEIKQRFHLSNLKANPQSFSAAETKEKGMDTGLRRYDTEKPRYDTEKPRYDTEKPRDDTEKPWYDTEKPQDDIVLFQEPLNSTFTQAKYLGQYSNCYLILEKETDLWFVDQHAFHERILFEEYVTEYAKHSVAKQSLLTPFIVSSSVCISTIAEEHKGKIADLGFEIEILSNSNIALHTYPAFLSPQKIPQTFDDILGKLIAVCGIPQGEVHPVLDKAKEFSLHQEIISIKNTELKQIQFYHLFYSTLACHNAVRAGDALNAELVQRLLNRSNKVDFFAHCPHGRPVIRKFNKKDVESWFLRI